MSRLTESAIEEFASELFERRGYQYIYAPDIAPDSETRRVTGNEIEKTTGVQKNAIFFLDKR